MNKNRALCGLNPHGVIGVNPFRFSEGDGSHSRKINMTQITTEIKLKKVFVCFFVTAPCEFGFVRPINCNVTNWE